MQIVLEWSTGLVPGMAASPQGGNLLSALPDPMKLDPLQIAFVMALVTVLFIYLKAVFFKPMVALVDQRERDIAAGSGSRQQLAALMDQRQAEHESRTREIRTRASERRKALAEAAQEERDRLVRRAKDESLNLRKSAKEDLESWRESARQDLVAQVDELGAAMARTLMARG